MIPNAMGTNIGFRKAGFRRGRQVSYLSPCQPRKKEASYV